MELVNWINIGILGVTALVGVLAWLGARLAARDARAQQEAATAAADRSTQAAEEATKLQARIVELEETRHLDSVIREKQAAVTARLVDQSKASFLVFYNAGQAVAKNLSVTVKSQTQVAAFSLDYKCQFFTVDTSPADLTLSPGSEYRYKAHFTGSRGFNPPIHVTVEWNDDSGVRGQWEGDLT